MPAAIAIVAIFCTLAAILHIAGILMVTLRGRRPGSPGSAPPDAPAVSVVRPVCGIENHIEATLASTFALSWPRYEIVFCVAAERDPIVPVVERLIAAHPDIPARLLVGDDRISINPKLNNLVKGWEAAQHGWIIMADSNVLMPADYIERLFARWTPGTGLVCSPPVGVAPEGLWSELECGFLNTFQARWQLAADAVGLGFAQGKTMLWRRDILEAAGGIRALAAEAAEDAAGTKIVRKRGLTVRLVPRPFPQPLGQPAPDGSVAPPAPLGTAQARLLQAVLLSGGLCGRLLPARRRRPCSQVPERSRSLPRWRWSRSGTERKRCSPARSAGRSPGARHSYGCCATPCCRASGSQRCAATASSGAATK